MMGTSAGKFVVVAALAAAVLAGCRADGPGETFEISIDSIQVEGSVSDNFPDAPSLSLDGAPVALAGSDFSVTVNVANRDEFTLEAADRAGNVSDVTIRTR